jgi:acetyl-CoA carboxylase biotin carboxyl carrier protein
MAAKNNGMDQKFINDLAEIMTRNDINEIELEEGETRVYLSRGAQQVIAAPAPAPAMAATAAAPVAAAPSAASAPAAPAKNANAVPSPMVGTAYLAPSPDADAFVKIGQKVEKGETIIIIEAMKTMNQIPSPVSGTVREILVEDAQPVEFGEDLIVIE